MIRSESVLGKPSCVHIAALIPRLALARPSCPSPVDGPPATLECAVAASSVSVIRDFF